MKVAMIARSSLFEVYGGDTVQVMNTAKYLKKKGVTVQIFRSNESIEYEEYDLLHFFNIIRPADILGHINKCSVPFVVSTIYVDYREGDQISRKGLMSLLSRLLGPFRMEYVKAIARMLVNGERIQSLEYLWRGQKSSICKLMCKAEMLLPNSNSEIARLEKDLGHQTDSYAVVPNGIDHEMFTPSSANRESNKVLCAARIENNKNQLNLIRALNNTDFELTLVGKAAPNQMAYFDQCKTEAASNVHFYGYVDSVEGMKELYQQHKVHVLPSWAETTGLSSLEAAMMGCSLVITDKGDTAEYFKEDAFYCNPAESDSISQAVVQAAQAPLNKAFQSRISENYTWEKAAKETLTAYKKVLNSKE